MSFVTLEALGTAPTWPHLGLARASTAQSPRLHPPRGLQGSWPAEPRPRPPLWCPIFQALWGRPGALGALWGAPGRRHTVDPSPHLARKQGCPSSGRAEDRLELLTLVTEIALVLTPALPRGTQRGKAICPKSHSFSALELGPEPASFEARRPGGPPSTWL